MAWCQQTLKTKKEEHYSWLEMLHYFANPMLCFGYSINTRRLYLHYKALCTVTTRRLWARYKVLVHPLQKACSGRTSGFSLTNNAL